MHLDTLAAKYYARVWGKVPGAYVLPTMPFNSSDEHASFRGTVSLSTSTVMLVVGEIVAGLRGQGFRKQVLKVLTVSHRGSLWVATFLKHVNRLFDDVVVVDAHWEAGPLWATTLRQAGLVSRGEVHGGAVSRILALYLTPGL